MARYYYIDPLAAAWMSDKFGMKFDDGDRFDTDDLIEIVANMGGGLVKKWYIQPDSEHLLEPVVGDVGVEADGVPCNYTEYKCWMSDGYLHTPKEPVKVIQRNGIPFHWPLSE